MEPRNAEEELSVLRAELAALRRETDLQLGATARALELQGREYERRLEDLNHAHELAASTLHTYLPRERYEADAMKIHERIEGFASGAVKREADIASVRSEVSTLAAAVTWLTRLVVGAVLTALITGVMLTVTEWISKKH